MSRWISLVAMCLAIGCGGGSSGSNDAAPQPIDAALPDASLPDAGTRALSSCLDRPNDLPWPPDRGLTCDLLPPGMTLKGP